MTAMEQGNSGDAAAERLWDFATTHYARGGVARCCLQAQDELGMDVILLLFAAWRAREGEALHSDAFAAAEAVCRPWRDAVVLPLRARRRDWKRNPPGDFEYAAIKQLELQAERAQLEMLAQRRDASITATPGTDVPAPDYAALLRSNLRALCRHYGAADDALAALQAALLS